MVQLICAIVGEAGSIFQVEIDDTESVSALKDAIKAEKPKEFEGINADRLKLFLAKKVGGAWLDRAGATSVALDERGHLQGCMQMKPTLCIKNHMHFGDSFQPSEGQVHVLVVVPVDSSISENKNKWKRKRKEDEDVPDAWIKAIKDEQITELPSTFDDLKKYLQRRVRVKIPINHRLFWIIYRKIQLENYPAWWTNFLSPNRENEIQISVWAS
ncbi:CRN-like protein [Plasmopara halstedii]|uniref:CRN-like protein n=1 Tax=Plasmopara halstedii TaxID=4781 RepID=A0A0P1B3B9_PLAHL|nr:CRN-like protein [Plasmopara halstedii]CEG48040.1 CRN-like protein [Plasmopara halstedii]|eukprot:XP_024584409.1 CRN-like protein [Plasmopara halstedii]